MVERMVERARASASALWTMTVCDELGRLKLLDSEPSFIEAVESHVS